MDMKCIMSKLTNFINWTEKYADTHKKYNAETNFLQLKDEITEYLERGFTVKLIYLYLKETYNIGYTYETFRRLINKHIKQKNITNKNAVTKNQYS